MAAKAGERREKTERLSVSEGDEGVEEEEEESVERLLAPGSREGAKVKVTLSWTWLRSPTSPVAIEADVHPDESSPICVLDNLTMPSRYPGVDSTRFQILRSRVE